MLEKNRKALEKRYRDLAQKIENSSCDENIKIEDGKLFYNDMELDEKKEVGQANIKSVDTIFVHGFGIGNTIKSLQEKYPKTVIVALETNLCILKKVFEKIDLSDIISNPKIIILSIDEDVKEKIASIINLLMQRLYWGNLIQVDTPDYDKIKSYDLKAIQELIYKNITPILLNRNTLMNKSKQIAENVIKNIPSLVTGGSIDDLNDKFKGKPAVIAASGPSLSKNVNLLKDIKDRCVIIAADSVIPTLKNLKITPDFVCGVDYQTINVEKYKAILEDKEKNATNYVCADGVYFSIPKLFKRSFLSFTPMSFMELYKELIKESKKKRFGVNAVTHMAVQLAYVLGANPIIFIGQDWAYSGGMEHAKGTSIEGAISKDVIWVKGNYEEKVPTTPTLYSGLKLVEDIAANLTKEGYKFINATEGGAFIDYTEVMSFQEAIDKFMDKNIDKGFLNTAKQPEYDGFIKKTRQIKKSLEDMVKNSSKALKLDKQILKVWKNTKNEDLIRKEVEIVNKINDEITFDKVFQGAVSTFYFKEFFLFNQEEMDIEGQDVGKRIEQSLKYFTLIKEKTSSAKKYVDNLYKYLSLEKKSKQNRDKFLSKIDDITAMLSLYFEFQNIYDGLSLADEAIKLYPDSASLYYWRAKLCSLNRFMYKDALRDFEKALELDSDFKKAKFDYEVLKKIIPSHLILAKTEINRQNFIAAKNLVQRALEHDPENKEVLKWMDIVSEMAKSQKDIQRQKLLFEQLKMESEAFEEYERVMEFVRKEELDKAYEKLLYLYEKYGAFGDIPFLLGSIMIDKNQLTQAEEYLKEAVELIPFQPLVYVALGKLYLMREDYFNAKENLEKALGMNDKLVGEISDALGNLYYEFGEYEKAVKTFQDYLPYSEDKKKTVLKIALCYKEMGMIKEYNALMDKIRELDSSN